MTWTCEQTEARLSDYLDRSLTAAELAAFSAHVPGCGRCAPLVAKVSSMVEGLHSMEQVDAPPRLVYAILDKTLGPREAQAGWRSMLGLVSGIASLRFAYGAISVAATLIIFVSAAGLNWRHPKLADLQPATIYHAVDRKAHMAYGSTIKFVNDLRVVNEIQSRLRQDETPTLEENTVPEPSPRKEPGHSDSSTPGGPRQQNRANELARPLEVLAADVPGCLSMVPALLISRRVL
jgi:anti-sigma factor RsiW